MKVIAEGKDPAEVKVAQVMTIDPRSLSEDTPKNFNPIDMVMTVHQCTFIEDIRLLTPLLPS